jgi:hypothetical protein
MNYWFLSEDPDRDSDRFINFLITISALRTIDLNYDYGDIIPKHGDALLLCSSMGSIGIIWESRWREMRTQTP